MSERLTFLIFDLDGTLIDSKRDIVLCANRALLEQGLREEPEAKIADAIGRGATHLFRQVLGASPEATEATIGALVANFGAFYDRHLLDHTQLYPGTLETLETLRALPKVIVTNKSQRFSERLADALGLSAHFEAIFGAEAFPTKKPDPGPLSAACRKWNKLPIETAIIGDSIFDIQAGKAAGTRTVAALYGFSTLETLRTQDPDATISDMGELVGTLRHLGLNL